MHAVKLVDDPRYDGTHVGCRSVDLAEEANRSLPPASTIAMRFLSLATSIPTVLPYNLPRLAYRAEDRLGSPEQPSDAQCRATTSLAEATYGLARPYAHAEGLSAGSCRRALGAIGHSKRSSGLPESYRGPRLVSVTAGRNAMSAIHVASDARRPAEQGYRAGSCSCRDHTCAGDGIDQHAAPGSSTAA